MPFGWVAAGAAVVSAVSSSDAARKQANAANHATDVLGNQYDKTRSDLAPYNQQGQAASTQLADLLGTSGNTTADGYGSLTHGFSGADYLANKDPGYDFQLQQGNQAIMNSAAAGNGALSPAALKGLATFNQGLASTGYQNAYDRWNTTNNNTYNRLAGILQIGEGAASQTGTIGANLAGAQAQTITGAGNAGAAGSIGVGNAISNGASNGMGYYQLNNILNPSIGGGYGAGSAANSWTGSDYGPTQTWTPVG
jgi:uncharacterized protein YukE